MILFSRDIKKAFSILFAFALLFNTPGFGVLAHADTPPPQFSIGIFNAYAQVRNGINEYGEQFNVARTWDTMWGNGNNIWLEVPDPSFGIKPTDPVALAKNEREGFQVVFREMGMDKRGIRLEVGDFKQTDGGGLLETQVYSEVFVEYWHDFADALVPYAGEVIIAPKDNDTPFYVELRSRKDTPAGDYTGSIAVYDADSGELLGEQTIYVKVWNFAFLRSF
jgi:hypothetical protein